MKAILIEKEITCCDEKIKVWEIKAGRKVCAKIWFPWSTHPETFTLEFSGPNLAVTGIQDVHSAAEKAAKLCEEFFGITKITDKKGYPIDLLAAFEDPLFADVC